VGNLPRRILQQQNYSVLLIKHFVKPATLSFVAIAAVVFSNIYVKTKLSINVKDGRKAKE